MESLKSTWQQSLALVGIIVLFLILLVLTAVVAERAELDRLSQSGDSQLDLFTANIRDELGKYAILPQLLARNERIVSLLLDPGDNSRVDRVNSYLQEVNTVARASATYVMNLDGMTLAASNWNEDRSFVGQNFSYRPYFQEAIQGRAGQYYALGTTSRLRGYYYSYPVRWANRILGVVVVKLSPEQIEESWSNTQRKVVVTDYNGVIFVTNQPDWRLRTMRPLAADLLERLQLSRQYGNEPLTPLPVLDERPSGAGYRFLTIRSRPGSESQGKGSGNRRYLVQTAVMPEHKWILHVLSDTEQVAGRVLLAMLLAALAFAAFALTIVYLFQRRRNYQQKIFHQVQVEETLRQARDQLEERVRERTADLEKTNQELDWEIDEHKRVERELRQAQEELIQAAKLAVIGQMSAGITHELNQPLAAINAYAENAHAYLARGDQGKAEENLESIVELTGRMAQITGQLRNFARKSRDAVEPVNLGKVINDALDLFRTQIDRQQVLLLLPDSLGDVTVSANELRLGQVLVNLVKNALDAMQDGPRRSLEFSYQRRGRRVVLSLRDTGPGISTEHRAQIFDPFFTTKKVGEGLGLGLSISFGIIRDFGGQLEVTNHSDGGAVFSIELDQAEGAEDAA